MDVEERIVGARKALELTIAVLKGHSDAFPDEELTEPNLRANLAKTLWDLSDDKEKLKRTLGLEETSACGQAAKPPL